MRAALGWLVLIISLVALIVLGGCTPAISCPPLIQYSSLEQSVLAVELVGDGPETIAQIEDYVALRQECRK